MRIFLVLVAMVAGTAMAEPSHDKSDKGYDHEKGYSRFATDRSADVVAAINKLDGFKKTTAEGPTGNGANNGHSNLVFETQPKGRGKTIGVQVMTSMYYDEEPIFWFDDAKASGKSVGLVPGKDGFQRQSPEAGETKIAMQKRLLRPGSRVTSPGEQAELLRSNESVAVLRGDYRDKEYRWITITVLRREENALRMQRFIFRDASPEQATQLLNAIQPLFDVSRGVKLTARD